MSLHRHHPALDNVYDLIERTCAAARHEISAQGTDLESMRKHVAALEERLDRFEMLTEMLLRIFQERGVATADDMVQVLREIDLEDGVEDRKWGHGQAAGSPPSTEENGDA